MKMLMNNAKRNSDVIEVFVKKKYGIKLTEDDEKLYSSLDKDIIDTLNALINSNSFLNDIENIINNINTSDGLTLEEKDKIEKSIREEKAKVLIKKN